LKPEWWGSPLVQEKYREKKACDKRQQQVQQNNGVIIIIIIIIIISRNKSKMQGVESTSTN